MAKESKTCQLKTTITPTLKKVLDEYCDVKKTTVAEFTRDCLTEKLLELGKIYLVLSVCRNYDCQKVVFVNDLMVFINTFTRI